MKIKYKVTFEWTENVKASELQFWWEDQTIPNRLLNRRATRLELLKMAKEWAEDLQAVAVPDGVKGRWRTS